METWKDIKCYEGLYQVSNLGRVRSLPRKLCKGTILKARDNGYGYLTVGLSKNNNTVRYKVHRLVAQTFLPNIHHYDDVNHKDGNKYNNSTTNLEWCSRSYNMKHAYKMGLLKSVPVLQLDKNGNIIKKWKGAKYVYEKLGIPDSNINRCCKGERNTAGGYRWKYNQGGDV
jgi:hypothetical protein